MLPDKPFRTTSELILEKSTGHQIRYRVDHYRKKYEDTTVYWYQFYKETNSANYTVNSQTCNCPDAWWSTNRGCKHQDKARELNSDNVILELKEIINSGTTTRPYLNKEGKTNAVS